MKSAIFINGKTVVVFDWSAGTAETTVGTVPLDYKGEPERVEAHE